MIEMKVEECLRAIGGKNSSGVGDEFFRGVSIDSRTLKKGELFVCIQGDRFDGHNFIKEAQDKQAAAIVLSEESEMGRVRGKTPVVIRVKNTLKALQELALFYRKKMPVKVIGITGTNGKSTTKEMTAAITEKKFKTIKTKGNLNNHIGLPLNIFDLSKTDEIAVMEMGMSAAGEIKRLAEIAKPEIGVVTNISEGHLVHLKTLKKVQAAKGELFDSLSEKETAIVNADDPLVLELAKSVRAKVITYGIYKGADIKAENICPMDREGFKLSVNFSGKNIPMCIPFLGECNIYNALAAIAASWSLGIAPDDIKQGLMAAKLLANRFEVSEHRGVTIINDSYNANPRSMKEALKILAKYKCKGRRFFIVGEMLELGDLSKPAHKALGVDVAKYSIDYLVTVGDLSSHVAKSAVASGMNKKNTAVASGHECAVAFIKKHSRSGDCLLVKGSRGSKMEEVVRRFVA
ncbi:MAG: UDP-N-acetylmuramoyl-tripeptide--D-alanyl-D-alanine ligase [Nitrospina sp.]|nr:UDP-N-acetylmuramoyl-tripeptide--D-alanyl-D-alanine ligase [Nitrospina sp.]